jgi:hypothetical protein
VLACGVFITVFANIFAPATGSDTFGFHAFAPGINRRHTSYNAFHEYARGPPNSNVFPIVASLRRHSTMQNATSFTETGCTLFSPFPKYGITGGIIPTMKVRINSMNSPSWP